MAYAILLQDWVVISGNSSITIQPEADYVQIQDFQDIAFYLEIGSVTNASATSLDVQTSPTKDEVFFGASISANIYLAHFSLSSATTPGAQPIQVVRWASATNQVPARFVRWKATFPAGATTVNFRLWLSLNQAGWR